MLTLEHLNVITRSSAKMALMEDHPIPIPGRLVAWRTMDCIGLMQDDKGEDAHEQPIVRIMTWTGPIEVPASEVFSVDRANEIALVLTLQLDCTYQAINPDWTTKE